MRDAGILNTIHAPDIRFDVLDWLTCGLSRQSESELVRAGRYKSAIVLDLAERLLPCALRPQRCVPTGAVLVRFLIMSSAGFPPLQVGCPKPLALWPFWISKIRLSLGPGATPIGTPSSPRSCRVFHATT